MLTGQATAWSSGDGTSNGDNISVTVPNTTLVGDTILVFLFGLNRNSAGFPPNTNPVAPAGYGTLLSNIHIINARGCAISVYSKTAVSGDIGATVSFPHIDISNSSILGGAHVRSYTCGGVDSSTSATGAAASLAAAFITSTVNSEAQVSLFACSSNGGISGVSLSAGGTNTMASQKPAGGGGFTAAFGAIAAEDWQLPTAGTTGAGGTFTPTGASSPANVCVSVMLLP